MNLDRRILAAHPVDQVRHHVLGNDVLDDPEQGRFFLRLQFVGSPQQIVDAEVVLVDFEDLDERGFGDLLVLKEVEQRVGVVVVGARERPGRAGYDALAAVRQAFLVELQGLVVDVACENVNEHHRVFLVAHRECVDDSRNDFRAELLQALDGLHGSGRARVGLAGEVADQLISAETAEERHQFALPSLRQDVARTRLKSLRAAGSAFIPAAAMIRSVISNAINADFAFAQAIGWIWWIVTASATASVYPTPDYAT